MGITCEGNLKCGLCFLTLLCHAVFKSNKRPSHAFEGCVTVIGYFQFGCMHATSDLAQSLLSICKSPISEIPFMWSEWSFKVLVNVWILVQDVLLL